MKSLVDGKTIEKAMQGDEEALQELILSVSKYVLFKAVYLVSNRSDAEDIAQEVLIRVCSGVRSLRSPKAFSAWLNNIIINETRRHWEKNSKHDADTDISEHIDTIEEENTDYIPHEYADRNERDRIIYDIVSKLPQRQKEAILLVYYEKSSVTEAARIMGVKHPNVSNYLKLAHEKIKQELEKQSGVRTGVFRGLILLPLGGLIRASLSKEALGFDTAGWEHSVWEHASSVANTADTQSIQYTATAAKSVVAPVIGIASTVVAASVIFFTVNPMSIPTPSQKPSPANILPAQGNVLFFSDNNDDREDINPSGAIAIANNELGAMTMLDWQVTAADSNDILHSGAGGTVDVNGVFMQMRESGENGLFMLRFTMEDSAGSIYELSRGFEIYSERPSGE